MPRLAVLAATLLLATGAAHADPVRYQLDPNHTQVQFRWNHMGFSHMSGRFDKVDADFLFDPADPTRSSLDVRIAIDSIDTGVAALDEHLRSADFFDAAQFPTARFTSTAIERVDDSHLRVTGILALHGVERPQVLDVTMNRVGMYPRAGRAAAGFDASATLQRSEFGIGRYVPNVGDDIAIAISTEAMVPKPVEDGAGAAP